MLSKGQRKGVRALHRKKGRLNEGAFLVEGHKSVIEVLESDWQVRDLFAVDHWDCPVGTITPIRLTPSEMSDVSALDTPADVLAVVSRPEEPLVDLHKGRWLLLDGLQDPGNLGTILRLADWFGIDGVVVSPDCVEWSNPKVVQASMGSLFRVPLVTRELTEVLDTVGEGWCAGAFLDGKNLYQVELPENGWLVIGNEGNGIRPEVEKKVQHRLTIPRFGQAESLNAAMATAVVCSEWRREPKVTLSSE